MGSSGMKRKGRKHLPKVGTRPADEHAMHDRRDAAVHPFAEDPFDRPRGAGAVVIGVLVAAFVAIGVVALMIAT